MQACLFVGVIGFRNDKESCNVYVLILSSEWKLVKQILIDRDPFSSIQRSLDLLQELAKFIVELLRIEDIGLVLIA